MSVFGKQLVIFIQAMFFGLAASLLVEFFGTIYGLLGAFAVIAIVAGFGYGFGVLSARFKAQIPELIHTLLATAIPLGFVFRGLTSDNSLTLAFVLLAVVIALSVFVGVRVQKSRN